MSDDGLREFLGYPFWDVFRVRDTDGRPLGESAIPEGLGGVPTEWKACPYGGSRRLPQKPMNVSALHQVTANWKEVCGLLAELRTQFGRWESTAEALSLTQLWRFGTTVVNIPHYLLNRASRPLSSGGVPVVVAALFKIAAGLFQVAEHMAVSASARGDTGDDAVDADVFIAYAERHRLFEGRHGVCSGPPNLIAQVVRTAVAPANRAPELLTEIVGPLGPFATFSQGAVTLQLGKRLLLIESVLYALSRGSQFQFARRAPEYVSQGARRLRELLGSPQGVVALGSLSATLRREFVSRTAHLPRSAATPDAALHDVVGPAATLLADLEACQRQINSVLERPELSVVITAADLARALGMDPTPGLSNGSSS
jgi:hypothetical protein